MGSPRARVKIHPAHLGRHSDVQFTHDHPSTLNREFLNSSDSTNVLGVYKVLSSVFKAIFFFIPGGKAYAFNSITTN